MKSLVLFSQPTENNIKQILDLTFPKEIKHKILAYMPSDGADCSQKYSDEWQKYANNYQADFKYIDNSKTNTTDEQKKVLDSNILVITGGNTFTLLRNLHRSSLFKTIQKFVKKEEFVISGFSTGAIILSPTVKICNFPSFDDNLVEIKNLTGLGIIDFEVFPHYSEGQKEVLENYKRKTKNEVKTITNEEYLVINSQ